MTFRADLSTYSLLIDLVIIANHPVPLSSLSQSPVFDNDIGFGGDGVPGTYTPPTDDDGTLFPITDFLYKGCVQTGPFANITLHVGPNKRFTDHCLVRGHVLAELQGVLSQPFVDLALGQPDYDNFWNNVDGLPFKTEPRIHDAGHAYIGGDMSSFYTSPNGAFFSLVLILLHIISNSSVPSVIRPYLLPPPRHSRPRLVDVAEDQPP